MRIISVYMASEAGNSLHRAAKAELTLKDAIEKGLKEEAHHASEMLKEHAPLEIINEHLIPALDTVGKGFERELSSCRSF